MPNSFLKRQLGVAPGAPAPARWFVPFWLLDQLDSLLGAVLLAVIGFGVSRGVVLWLVGITLVLHPLVSVLMMMLKLKDRVG